MNKVVLIMMLLFGAFSTFAADLTGDWKGTIKAPNGELEVTYKLKADGERLLGKVVTRYGEHYLIEGKIVGDAFTFKLEIEENIVELNGKVEGDAIIVKTMFQGSEIQDTVKRIPQ
jgi:lipopolysaccharide export system protein LptA